MPQRVPGYALVEHLEADAVVQVFAGMDFEAQIHVLLVAGIQHRQPAPRQFVERGLDQSLRPLRKREQVGPGEGARERAHLGQAQPARRARRQQQVAPGPFGARRRIASDRRRREGVEHRVVGRMHGQQLAEDVRGQFADDQAVAGQHAGDLVAIVLAGRGQFHVEEALVPGRHLQGLEAQARRPFGDGGQAVERRVGAAELREVDARAFEGLHDESAFGLPSPGSP